MTTRSDKDEWFDGDADDAEGELGADAADAADDPADADVDAPAGDVGEGASFGNLPPPPGLEDDPDEFDAEALFEQADAGVVAERDQYRDALLRVKADFDNYKKRVAKDHAATVERAAEKLVGELLPILDACEAAIGHGAQDVEPIYKSLLDTLEKSGLVQLHPEGEPFDPNIHDAVMHEPSDDEDEHVVIESLRTGYTWNGRVLRPAMVKVRG